MGWQAAPPRGSLQGLAPPRGSSNLALGGRTRGTSARSGTRRQDPNVPAEHKRNLRMSRTSCSIKEERRTEAGSGGGVCDASGMWATPTLLTPLPAREGFPVLEPESRQSPGGSCVVVGFWARVWCQRECPAGRPRLQMCAWSFLANPSVYWLCVSFSSTSVLWARTF